MWMKLDKRTYTRRRVTALTATALAPSLTGLSTVSSAARARQRHQGTVVLIIDDGRPSLYNNAFPIAEAHNIPLTAAVITDRIEDSPARASDSDLTTGKLDALQAAGHEICSHSATHPEGFDELSEAELEDELGGSAAWLDEHGYQTRAVVYPRNQVDEEVIEVASQYYDIGFGSRSEAATLENGIENWMTVPRVSGHEDFSTITGIQGAAEKGHPVVVMLHNIGAELEKSNSITEAEFERICKVARTEIDAGRLQAMTATELRKEYEQR